MISIDQGTWRWLVNSTGVTRGESNTLVPFLWNVGIFSDIEPSCECAWNKCTMTLEQEHATALLPNSQTKWILSLLSRISVSGRKWGTSGTLWGTPCATAIFCWKKKACLGQTENSVGWISKTKNGVILSAPEAACFWLWLRMRPPRWSCSLWEEPVRCCHSSS